MLSSEPVRGQVPPPWFWALPGIERVEALARGLLPLPPLCRLLGIRPGHVGPGLGTWTMPASAALQIYLGGDLDVDMLPVVALEGVAMTTLAPGLRLEMVSTDVHSHRPTRMQPGNLVARARVVNANPFFIFAEVQVEDPQGRQLCTASGHLAIVNVDPPPPDPPPELPPVEEARYAQPDPYLRRLTGPGYSTQQLEGLTGDALLAALADPAGSPPFLQWIGYRMREVSAGVHRFDLTASPWLALFRDTVHPSMISSIVGMTSVSSAMTLQHAGESFSGFTHATRFPATMEADGSPMQLESRATRMDGAAVEVTTQVVAASGAIVARGHAFGLFLDASKRRRPRAAPGRRVLYTLLFTDIVDSTQQLERLGDERWHALLDQHHQRLREEVARFEGTEVDAQGDGFFARFTSPAMALRCAHAARDAVRLLGLEIRAGLHTGECEERGAGLAGVAVHLASRIQGRADPGEILVSSTLKELVAGSGLRFRDRGEHELKGIEGKWRLHALDDAPG